MRVRKKKIFPEIQEPIDYANKFNPAFVAWVDSINRGFQHIIPYEPFQAYVDQADQWLSDETKLEDFILESQQVEWVASEFDKFRRNTLYFLNKLGTYKDADREEQSVQMKGTKAQEVMLFLSDNKYSIIAGKARHVAFTTAMGMYAIKKISYVREFYAKFITHNQKKGQELLRDKFKFPFMNLPDWARVSADTSFSVDKIITSSRGKSKTERKGTGATIEVCSPTDDAINGGSPSVVLIDEIGFIKNIDTIIREGRPTMFRKNAATGKLEMKRQFIGWGTASLEGTKISYFKEVFQFAMEQWEKKNYGYGIIPLFFNCCARDGWTMEHYLSEKAVAEAHEGIQRESALMTFYQHNPMTIEDMFVSGSKTIIPFNIINDKISEIRSAQSNSTSGFPQYGYFDTANGPIDDFISGKLRVAPVPLWIKTSGILDPRTTAIMHRPPDHGWVWRYFKGTDPINTKTGHSKFASTIWDEEFFEISCTINIRKRLFKECYMQGILQTLFYSNPNHQVKELCENNIGDMYMDMMEGFGIKSKHLIQNVSLPPKLRTSDSNDYGIRKTPANSVTISNNLLDMLQNYMGSIYEEQLFIQLKTFTEKELKTGNVAWAPESRFDFDDVIDAAVYSYVAAHCFRFPPAKVSTSRKKVITKFVMDDNWTLRKAKVDADGNRQYI